MNRLQKDPLTEIGELHQYTASLYRLTQHPRLRKDTEALLRLATGRVLKVRESDRRKARLPDGLKRIFKGLVFYTFALNDQLQFRRQSHKFDENGWRQISRSELRRFTGCTNDELDDYLRQLEKGGLISRYHPPFDQETKTRLLYIRLCVHNIQKFMSQLPSLRKKARKRRLKDVLNGWAVPPGVITPWALANRTMAKEIQAKIPCVFDDVLRYIKNCNLAIFYERDKRKTRIAAGNRRLLNMLIFKFYRVDLRGRLCCHPERFDQDGWRRTSCAEIRHLADLTQKEYRNGFNSLEIAEIVEIRGDQRRADGTFWIRVNFDRLREIIQDVVNFKRSKTSSERMVPVLVRVPLSESTLSSDQSKAAPRSENSWIQPKLPFALIPATCSLSTMGAAVHGARGIGALRSSYEKNFPAAGQQGDLFLILPGERYRYLPPPAEWGISAYPEMYSEDVRWREWLRKPMVTLSDSPDNCVVLVPESVARIAWQFCNELESEPIDISADHLKLISRWCEACHPRHRMTVELVRKYLDFVHSDLSNDWELKCKLGLLLKAWPLILRKTMQLTMSMQHQEAGQVLQSVEEHSTQRFLSAMQEDLLHRQKYFDHPDFILHDFTRAYLLRQPDWLRRRGNELRCYLERCPITYYFLRGILPFNSWLSLGKEEVSALTQEALASYSIALARKAIGDTWGCEYQRVLL